MPEELKSGEKVISLAAAARSAAFLAGMITGGVVGWIVKHQLIITVTFTFCGAIIGWAVGTLLGKILFPAQTCQVIVIKAGPNSIPSTIKGNIIACLVTGVMIFSLAMLILETDTKTIAVPSICIPLIIGTLLALATSLL